MSLLTRLTPDNPVLTKELRVRMRGARAYWILLGYLGFLAIIMLFRYGSWAQNTQFTGASESSKLGVELFNWMMATQVFLVLFITPAVTSGALTIEREQQTIDLLTLTRMPRSQIIAGKLLSAVAFTALLVVSSIPLVSVCFMLGGIDPSMMVGDYLKMLTASFLIGGLGLMWSSIARTTTSAVMCTYSTLFVLFVFGAASYGMSVAPNVTGSLLENLFHAAGGVLFGPSFLGMGMPEGAGFCVIAIIVGILFSAIAMSRMEMWPERRGPLLRGLSLLALAVELISLNLWWLQAWYQRSTRTAAVVSQAPVAALIFTGFLLMLLIPIFATGEVSAEDRRNFKRYLAGGWSRKGVVSGKLSSGLPFLLVLTTACIALYIASFVIVGHPRDIATSGATTATKLGTAPIGIITQGIPFPGSTPPPPAMDPTYSRKGDFLQAATLLYVFTIGFSLLCIALSLLLRNRWAAWLIAYAILGICMIIPEVSHGAILAGGGPNAGVLLYYVSPLQGLAQMADPSHYYLIDLTRSGALPSHSTPMWCVTSALWAVIGLLSIGLIALAVRRNGSSQPAATVTATSA